VTVVEGSFPAVDEDETLRVPLPGVRANDRDVVSVELARPPSHGTVALAGDGSFEYVPAPEWSGTDSFTYRGSAQDASTDEATVTVVVNPILDPLTAQDDDVLCPRGGSVAFNVLANDTNPDGFSLSAELLTQPATGTVTLLPTGEATYSSNAPVGTLDSFTYVASDGVSSAEGRVWIRVARPDGFVHVDGTRGDDATGDGTTEQPFATIGAGISDADPGETVLVAPGTYEEDISLRSSIGVCGSGPDETVVQGSGANSVVTASWIDDTTVADLTITGGNAERGGGMRLENSSVRLECVVVEGSTAQYGAGIYVAGGAPTFVDVAVQENSCTVRPSCGAGVYICSGAVLEMTDSLVAENTIEALVSTPVPLNGAGICSIESSATIVRTRIERNRLEVGGARLTTPVCAFGAGVYAGSSELRLESSIVAGNTTLTVIGRRNCADGAGVCSEDSVLSVVNCTITDNSTAGGNGGVYVRSGAGSVTASILWGNGDDLYGCPADYSAIEDGAAGPGNIASDPLFVDRWGGDYRLLIDSPCIDATTTAQTPSTDIREMTRPVDFDGDGRALADMGAFEVQPPAAVADAWQVTQDTGLVVPAPGVLANDDPGDCDSIDATLVAGTAHGAVVLKPDGSFTYTPNDLFLGTDTFTYRAVQDPGSSAPTVVTLTVSRPADAIVDRIFGDTRYDTAIEASRLAFPDGADAVIIASGEDWPDALSGSALAGTMDGPLLLTASGALPDVVAAEVVRLRANRAVVLGGELAVSEGVAARLAEIPGLSVSRIGGSDRYDTAASVALEVRDLQRAAGGDVDAVLVASGVDFADAAAASPLAAYARAPILLTTRNALPSVSVRTISQLAPRRVVVLGGEVAVSDAVESDVTQLLPGASAVTRAAGATRFETAAAIATCAVDEFGMSWNGCGIASGAAYPDALTGGVMLGAQSTTLLLTKDGALPLVTWETLHSHREEIGQVRILGGHGVVWDEVDIQARQALSD
ncbi:MAG: cell wall-binding repeat-containing protein, partial [Candidatus Eisenbacteria bacterium]|nr:cell wall-binding repeat-containing protein [Candidatus Eisenbacteria bacterium]